MAVWLTEGKNVRDIAEATGQAEGGHLLAPETDLPEAALWRQADLVRLVLSLAELG